MFDVENRNLPARGRSLLDTHGVPAGRDMSAGNGPVRPSLLDQPAEPEPATRRRRSPRLTLPAVEQPPVGPATQPEPTVAVAPQPVEMPPVVETHSEQQASGIRERLKSWLSPASRPGQVVADDAGDPVVVVVPEKPISVQSYENLPAEGEERPLIDLATVVASVWSARYLIAVLAVLGAIAGVLLALATPNSYVAQTKLYVDPREVRLTDSDLSKQSLATEGILALVDSQLEVLRSRDVLEKVVTDLGLERDAEFGVVKKESGFGAGLAVLREMVMGAKPQAPGADVAGETLEKLTKALSVFRDPKTFIITVEVKSRDAEKSALIANRIVSTFLTEENSAQSGFFQRTTEALDGRITELSRELDLAEKAVEKFKAENDIVGASGELIADKQLSSLNDQVAAVRSRIAEARAKVDVVTKIQLNDVLSGAYPEEVNSATLAELRKQYSAARSQLGSLDTSLGPRHPQRLAAAQALEIARAEIGNELSRVAARASTELQRAQSTEQDLVRQLNTQKARQINASSGFVELRELERNATATRAIYESFLKRARETGEEEKLTTKNIRVISTAEPPLDPVGPSRKLIVIGGLFLGLMAGIGLAVLQGVYQSLRRLFDPVLPRPVQDRTRAPVNAAVHGPAQTAQAEPVFVAAATVAAPARAEVAPVAEIRPVQTIRPAPAPVARTVSWSDDAALAWRTARGAVEPVDNTIAGFGLAEAPEARTTAKVQDPRVSQVQDNIRALRARVEHYSRQRANLRS